MLARKKTFSNSASRKGIRSCAMQTSATPVSAAKRAGSYLNPPLAERCVSASRIVIVVSGADIARRWMRSSSAMWPGLDTLLEDHRGRERFR
jgi:hypothetical protein